jgi:2-hydroxy-6-oxonona-2,4-dienedioate hydrolase
MVRCGTAGEMPYIHASDAASLMSPATHGFQPIAMKRALLLGMLVLAGLGGAIYAQYRVDLAEALRVLKAGSTIVHTPCGAIEYSVLGTGPAVLVVHGAGGGYSQVAGLQVLLADAGFTAVAMSRFGYLRTPLPPDATPAAQAAAHACLLDALGGARAAVIGLSAGAPSALQYCALHSDRCTALVLLVPAFAVPGRDVADTTPPSRFWSFVYEHVLQSDFVIWALTRLRPQMLVETVLATPLPRFENASTAEQERALAIIRDIFPVSLKRDGLQNDARATTPAAMTNLHLISAPTLAISARDDLYGTAEGARYAADEIVGARLLLLDDGGHAWLGHHAEVEAALVLFLSEAVDAAGK